MYTHCPRGGSASLLNHLNSAHPFSIQPSSTGSGSEQEGSVAQYYPKLSKLTPPNIETVTEDGFKRRLLNFIITTDQPFSIVETPGFAEFINYCSKKNSKTILPSQVSIRSWIKAAYDEEKAKLKAALGNSKGQVSFILDGWTSSNQKAFQGVIACWINDDWELSLNY